MPIDKGFREIDSDMAVSMCEHGFDVFVNGSEKKIGSLDEFDFEGNDNVYYASAAEIEQEKALCSVVDGLDKLNDLAYHEARETESILTVTLADYATDLYENGDCKFEWSDGKSDWQNIAASIISGDTEYIHTWFDDLPENLPYFENNQGVSIAEYRNTLTQYEEAYCPTMDKLCDKVNSEYKEFISDMNKEPVGVVIESAYEIVWKDNINLFIENEYPSLSAKQLQALLSSRNTLDEIYEQWLNNGDLNTYSDIQTALEETANNILTSLENRIDVSEEKSEGHKKATALVNGELKELPVIFDRQGADVTSDFLKETVNNVSAYYEQRQKEDQDPALQDGYEVEDLPSSDLLPRLPPFEVEKEISINPATNQLEMSQAAFEWFEQYVPKHNKMCELENQLLSHIQTRGEMSDFDFYDTYRGNGAANLDEAAEVKSLWLQEFAKRHSITVNSEKNTERANSENAVDEKPRKLSLSERIDKARADNPKEDAPQQDRQQTKKQAQEI